MGYLFADECHFLRLYANFSELLGNRLTQIRFVKLYCVAEMAKYYPPWALAFRGNLSK